MRRTTGQPVGRQEHVLGAAQPDALGAEAAGGGGVLAGVGVGPDAELAAPHGVGPRQDGVELRRWLGGGQRMAPEHDLAGRAVERDDVALVDGHVAGDVNERPVILIVSAPTTAGVPQPRATTAAWLTEPAASGQDALGDHHAVDVLGARLVAHEDHLLAPVDGAAASSAVKYTLPTAAPGDAARPLATTVPSPENCGWSTASRCSAETRVSASCLVIFQRLRALAGALRHVDGHPQRGRAGALADPRLEHPELALLDGELGVAHVPVVRARAG